jgi:hypothetical protein
MYLAALEPLIGFFFSKKIEKRVFLSNTQVSCLLSELGGWWWLSANATQSRVVYCWHILPDIPSFEYCVFTHGSFFFTAFCHFSEFFFRLDLLVH